MTGILIDASPPAPIAAPGPLLITFGATTINGGTTGLVLSGTGLALTGGGGAVPGGAPIGGGMAPGDGLFGGSLGSLAFAGQSGNYIEFQNGALFDPGMPTVIDASNVTFDGMGGRRGLTQAQQDAIMDRIVEWNDDNTLGLIFLPDALVSVPRDREFDPIPGKENTPGDTLFRLTGGIESNPWGAQSNAFCFAYSLGGAGGGEEKEVCVEPAPQPGNLGPNQYLQDFWNGWQEARQ